jgi:hypothetical protein
MYPDASYLVRYFLLFILLMPAAMTVKSQSAMPGFFLDSWTPKTIEIQSFDSVSQTTADATVTVVIEADSVVTLVSRYVYGHNAAAWGGKLNESSRALENIKNLSPNVIRWPGGSMSNNYFWKASSQATCPPDLPPPPHYEHRALHYGSNNVDWTMSVDNYYDLLKKTGSEGSISINYSYARYGTSDDPVLAAARYAADWVRYDNGRTKFWEIGNENYGSWESGYTIDTKLNKDGQPRLISGELYGKHCRVFIREMRKAALETGHDIKIGVVTRNEHVNYTDNVMNNWNKGMMAQVADVADFFIPHSYFTPYNQNSGVATILNSETKVQSIRQYIDNGLKTHAGMDPLPIALTEWNIFAMGSMQQVSYINGMHAALVLGESIKNKLGMAIRWDLVNGWSNGDNHGIFADGEPGIPRYTPRAPFFHMYYFQKYFGDRMVHSTVTGSNNVVCYASRFYSGHSGIVIVNKGEDQVVKINVDNFNPGSRYYYYVLTGGSDNGNFSRKVYVNGVTTGYDGGGPDNYATLRPYGTEIDGDIKLDMPRLSALFILIESDTNLIEQTIAFDPLSPVSVGDNAFEISATASSGLPVRFASHNPGLATVRDGIVQVKGAGTVDIIAIQDGDVNYKPAGQVIQTLVVEKGDQAILMELPEEVSFSGSLFEIDAGASSGLPLEFTSSNSEVAVVSDGAIRLTGVGTTEITAFQNGNRNFIAAEPVTKTLQVTRGHQSITMDTFNDVTFGDPDFDIVATSTSGLPLEFSSSNPEVVIVNNGTVTITGAGTAEITASQEGDTNYYPASPVLQPLTVLKSEQTIDFPELPEKTTDDTEFEPGAVASSGLECAFTSSDHDVAVIINGMIHIIGKGSAEIAASQKGNANFHPAPVVSQLLVVTSPTGTRAPVADEFRIFPNPASDFLTIITDKEVSKLSVYNSGGVLVYSIENPPGELNIPVGQLGGSGIYYVMVNSAIKKVVVAN